MAEEEVVEEEEEEVEEEVEEGEEEKVGVARPYAHILPSHL